MPRELTLTSANAAQIEAELLAAGLDDVTVDEDGGEVTLTIPDDVDGLLVDQLASRHFPVSLLDAVDDAADLAAVKVATRAAIEKVLSIAGVTLPDTTPPTLVSATYTFPIVTATFSEEIQATDYSVGVFISDNVGAQVIEDASRRADDHTKVEYDMGAVDYTGQDLFFGYGGGDYRDMSDNMLDDIESVTIDT